MPLYLWPRQCCTSIVTLYLVRVCLCRRNNDLTNYWIKYVSLQIIIDCVATIIVIIMNVIAMVEIINYDGARSPTNWIATGFRCCRMISFSRRIPYQQCSLIICSEKVLNVIAFDDRFFFRCVLIGMGHKPFFELPDARWFVMISTNRTHEVAERLVGVGWVQSWWAEGNRTNPDKIEMDRFPRISISAKWRNIWEITH